MEINIIIILLFVLLFIIIIYIIYYLFINYNNLKKYINNKYPGILDTIDENIRLRRFLKDESIRFKNFIK